MLDALVGDRTHQSQVLLLVGAQVEQVGVSVGQGWTTHTGHTTHTHTQQEGTFIHFPDQITALCICSYTVNFTHTACKFGLRSDSPEAGTGPEVSQFRGSSVCLHGDRYIGSSAASDGNQELQH